MHRKRTLRQAISIILAVIFAFPSGLFAENKNKRNEVEEALQLVEKSYSDLFRALPETFTIQEKTIKEVRTILIKLDEDALAPLEAKIVKLKDERHLIRGKRKEINRSILKDNVRFEQLEEKRDKFKDDGASTADIEAELAKLTEALTEKQKESEALRHQLDGDTKFAYAEAYERLEVIEDELDDATVEQNAADALKKEKEGLLAKIDTASGLNRHIKKIEREKYLIQAKNSHKFSKLNTLQIWPARLHEIRKTILAGKEENRKHGKVDDIGDLSVRKTDRIKIGGILPSMISKQSEIAMGNEIAKQILQSQGVKQHVDPAVAEYVNRLGNNLVQNSDRWSPFTFHVLADPPKEREVNAFALPGGQVFVHDTLILSMKSEGELAGVLAHEIAHVNARHAAKVISKMQYMQYAAMAGIIFGGLGYIAYQGIGMAMNVAALGITRSSESEADLLGTQTLSKSGYDPRLLIAAFDRLLKNERLGGSSFWRTHPSTEDRMAKVEEEVRYLAPNPNQMIDTAEFHEVQKLIRKGRLEINKTRKDEDKGRPTLKRQGECDNCEEETPDLPPVLKRKPKADPENADPTSEKAPGTGESESTEPVAPVPDPDDDRPVLKREPKSKTFRLELRRINPRDSSVFDLDIAA